MVSLRPRMDMFRFLFPKDYFPKEVLDKYDALLNKNTAVIKTAIDYLNESVAGISFPGCQDLLVEQGQIGRNAQSPIPGIGGKINVEPHYQHTYVSSDNILSKIDQEFKVSLRQNQGFLNYWLMYETMFHRYIKPERYQNDHEVFDLFILNEEGIPTVKVMLYQPQISGIDGLEFGYDKMERQKETFDVSFRFNNLNMDFIAQ